MTVELIGRAAELERIAAWLDRARRGRGGLLLLRGDAGVGKTSLLDAGVALATGQGFRTLLGRADEFDQRLPFAALRLALGPALADERSPHLVENARRLDAALRLAAIPRGESRGPQVFELLHRMVTGWASQRPVLLAVDDLHCADADTVAALGFLTRQLRDRVVIAVTTRSRPPDVDVEMAVVVERLISAGPSCDVEVAPLDVDETTALVSTGLGGTPGVELAEQIWTSTRGNPFFVVELTRALDELGMVWVEDGQIRLASDAPMTVSAGSTVLQRVFRLGPAARQVAQASAVLPEVHLDDLGWIGDVTGLSPDALDSGFDALVGADLLRHAGDGFQFTHPIVRNTIYEDLGPAARRRLHGSIAGLRLRQRTAGHPIEVLGVARHLRLAASPGDTESGGIFIEAGDVSVAHAPRSAAAWYEDALRVLPNTAPNRGAVLLRLARAHFLASHKRQAATVAREALALLPEGPSRSRAAELCVVALHTSGQFDEALKLFDEYAGDPATVTSRLVAHRAQLLLWLDRIAEAEVELARAQELVGPDGDHVIDGIRLSMLWTAGRPAEARSLAERMWSQLPDQPSLRRHALLIALASAAVYNGEPRAATAALVELGEPALVPGVVGTAVVYERMLTGHWDEALERAATTERELEEGDRAFLPLLLAAVAHMTAERGELAAGEALRTRLLSFPIFQIHALVAVGHLDLAAGRLDQARALLRRAHASELRVGRYGTLAPTALELIDVELASDREEQAKQICATVDQYLDDQAGAQSRACHYLARALVHRDAADAAAALAVATENGLPFEQARARYLLGTYTRDADQLVAAAEAFRRLRVPARERAAVTALRRLGRRMPRSPRGPGALTETERQLAQLAGEGLTNRQIAATMHLSPKTIEHYLSRLYAKSGCSSRVELARAIGAGQLEV